MLACVIFISFLFPIAVMFDRAGWCVSQSYGERTLYIAARSVLAGYDQALLQDYGLMGVKRSDEEILKEMQDFMKQMSDHSLFSIKMVSLQTDTSGRNLGCPNILKEQIMKVMQEKIVFDSIHNVFDIVSGGQIIEQELSSAKQARQIEESTLNDQEDIEKREPLSFGESASFSSEVSEENRVLRNKRIIDVLPSGNFQKSSFLSGVSFRKEDELMELGEKAEGMLKNLEGGIVKAKESIYLDQYILSFFNHHLKKSEKETFFLNEIEYILHGSYDDQRNYTTMQTELFVLRTGLNLMHIYADHDKRTAAMEAAVLIAGPFAVAPVHFVICTAWAAAEAANDIDILNDGGKVPLIKTNNDWCLSLDQILSSNLDHISKKDSQNGLAYQDYLYIFLALKGEEVKLYRVMDLIQINMKGRYHTSFILENYLTGFSVYAELKREQMPIFVQLPFVKEQFAIKAVHTY